MIEANRYTRFTAFVVLFLSVSLYLHLLSGSPTTLQFRRAHSRSLPSPTYSGRQPYDVRKIIDAFRHPHDDLVILCAHRGLRSVHTLFSDGSSISKRWNGTAENSRDSYFRASHSSIECIETDLQLTSDGVLIMLHDDGPGRTTDIGEQSHLPAYNPFTGTGFNPRVDSLPYTNLSSLHLRDESGRVRGEHIPTLTDMVHMIRSSGLDVVLQLDFKTPSAVEPAYWALNNLTNAKGVPANEWCIYKLQAGWYPNATVFESLPWVKDAFASGTRLAYIPVYEPSDAGKWDMLAGWKSFEGTNYTVSAEVEMRSEGYRVGGVWEYVNAAKGEERRVGSTGVFFPGGDFVAPISSERTFWDTANYTLPDDARVNNSVFVYEENKTPQVLDWLTGDVSVDGHDYRQDFDWLMKQKYNWVITDNADLWSDSLAKQGKRNISHMIEDGEATIRDGLQEGWYRRLLSRGIW
ncbi:Hypothetical protein D9617_9g023280 [Elsinoe fawcettii]|nr:Hypothetical protein D9617_9g023280 [Elsinoe fawcettii]